MEGDSKALPFKTKNSRAEKKIIETKIKNKRSNV